MKRALYILTLLFLLVITGQNALASGKGAATLYNQGNALYEKGDFDGALKSYSHALLQRVADPRLEQNIGSAYLKLGNIGMAIYHFERGLVLGPRDKDLKHNLKYAKLLRKDEIPEKDFFFYKWFTGVVNYFTSGEFLGVICFLFVTLSISLLLIIFIQGRLRPAIIWTGVCFALLLMVIAPFGATRFYKDHFIKTGVLVGETIIARSGPSDEQPEIFTAHGGMPCRVLESRGGWSRIAIKTGLMGWVLSKEAKVIEF